MGRERKGKGKIWEGEVRGWQRRNVRKMDSKGRVWDNGGV